RPRDLRENRATDVRFSVAVDENVEIIAGPAAEQQELALSARRIVIDVEGRQRHQTPALTERERPELAFSEIAPPWNEPCRRLKRCRGGIALPERSPFGLEPLERRRRGDELE